jgi:hypothetical protein
MAGRRLLLCLVAAGIVAQAASAAEPSWRRADNARALRIGLTAKDAGPGWHEVGSKRSPSTVDLGSIMSSAPATACLGQNTPTKAEADLIITGGSISTLGRSLDTLTSFVMLFKTSTLAREQMPSPAAVGAVKSCVASQLKADLGGTLAGAAVSVTRRRLQTGSPLSQAYRIEARLPVGSLYVDLVMQSDGRGIVETLFLSLAVPPAASLERHVTGISARRLARYAV